ncbi:MAG: hypothetical protein Q9170_006869 [Blastenia crenularia]
MIDSSPTPTQVGETEQERAAVPSTAGAYGVREEGNIGSVATKVEHQVSQHTTTSSVLGDGVSTTTENESLAKKVQNLERQLKESQDRTEALMQNLMGGLSNVIQSAFTSPRTTDMTTPAATQVTTVKRERVKEQGDDGSPGGVPRPGNRSIKRYKTVIEID